MKKPLVTIGISAYNHEEYIEEAILSIVNQTYGFENIQLIVIDDCSSDKTGMIAQSLCKNYSFRFIQNKINKGVAANKNKIYELTEGLFSCGCASDDYFETDKIEKQIRYFQENPDFDLVYSDFNVIDDSSKIIEKPTYSAYKDWVEFSDIFLSKIYIKPSTLLYKKQALDNMGEIPEGVINEDAYILLKMTSLGAKIGYLSERLVNIRRHDTNASKRTWMMYNASRQLLDTYKDHPLYDEAIDERSLEWFYSLSLKYKKEALKWFPKASKRFYNKLFIAGLIQLLGVPVGRELKSKFMKFLNSVNFNK